MDRSSVDPGSSLQHLVPKVGTIDVVSDSTVSRLGVLAERRWGMFTTAQAEAVGVSRKQLVRMTASGVLERLTQGVYRMAGSPPQDHENIYATWLALGGATSRPTETGAPALVAAGVTAAVVHDIGDFFLDGIDFIVGSRKTTRLPDVRLRIRPLTPADTTSVNGLPTLTIERTITDLLTIGDGAVVRKDSFFAGYRAHNGVIQTGAVSIGEDALVAERAEDDAFGSRHVQRLETRFGNTCEHLVGGVGGGVGFEDDDHEPVVRM